MLQFKSREATAPGCLGRSRPVLEDGSQLGRQSRIVQVGLHLLRRRQQASARRLVPVSQPMPDVTELPDKGFEWHEQWAVNMKCITGADAGIEVIYKADNRRRHPGRRRTDRGGARPAQRRPARRQGVADRAPRKRQLPALAVREDLDPGADDRRLDAAERSGAGAGAAVAAHVIAVAGGAPSSRVAAASPDADEHLKRRGRLQRPRLTFSNLRIPQWSSLAMSTHHLQKRRRAIAHSAARSSSSSDT